MSSQRPAWFRFSAMRAPAPPPPAPTPAPTPPRPTGPAPPLGRPAFPFRGPPPPTQTQEPPAPTAPPSPPRPAAAPPVRPPQPPSSVPPTAPPSPPRPAAAPPVRPPPAPSSLPPTAPSSPPAQPPAAPPRSPSERPPQPSRLIPPAPQPSPPRAPPAASPATRAASPPRSPRRSPATPPAAPPRPTVNPPTPRQSPLRAPAAPPSPAKPVPPPSSAGSKETLTSTNYQRPSSSVPTPPKNKTSPPPPKSASPEQKSVAAAPSEPAYGRAATPVSSPKIKPLSHPPSPFTLPPPQIKTDGGRDHHEPRIEQKTVLVHETNSEKPMKMQHNSHYNHGSIVPNAKREPPTKDKATLSKKTSDSEGHGMRIITLAGDNKGATMEISQPHKKNHPYTLQTNSKSDEEGKSNNRNMNKNAVKTQYEPMTSYFNSNVQGINNSIVYNSTIGHKDPGIHLSLSRKARGDHRNKD